MKYYKGRSDRVCRSKVVAREKVKPFFPLHTFSIFSSLTFFPPCQLTYFICYEIGKTKSIGISVVLRTFLINNLSQCSLFQRHYPACGKGKLTRRKKKALNLL